MEESEEVLEAKPDLFMSIFNIGIVVHELAHYLGAIIVGVEVKKVVLLESWGGVVVHAKAKPFENWIIALMPFLVCNLVAFFLFADVIRAFNSGNILYLVFAVWLGISTAIYSDPSPPDLKSAWKITDEIWRNSNLVEKIAFLFLLPFIYLTLIIMEVKQQLFAGLAGRLFWVAAVFIIAKSYVSTLG